MQENIIIHLVKGRVQEDVLLSFSEDDSFSDYRFHSCPFESILKKGDEELFVRIPLVAGAKDIEDSSSIRCTLSEIGIQVSTGPIVDFRLREFLLDQPEVDSVPLLYPCHFENTETIWPRDKIKKPNAIKLVPETQKWLWPNDFYVVVRRISSKEEKHRIVASLVNPALFHYSQIIFENHLNVFHVRKSGLDEHMAYGLAFFLNSFFVDECFRSFNGHTQVNATDLRALKYPSREELMRLGKWAKRTPRFNARIYR